MEIDIQKVYECFLKVFQNENYGQQMYNHTIEFIIKKLGMTVEF